MVRSVGVLPAGWRAANPLSDWSGLSPDAAVVSIAVSVGWGRDGDAGRKTESEENSHAVHGEPQGDAAVERRARLCEQLS